MNITLHIEAVNPGELQEAIAGLAGIVGGTVSTPLPEPEKPKRISRVAPKPEPEKQPDSEPVVESGTSEGAAEETTDTVKEEIPTVVELRAKAQEKGTTPEGKKAIKALLDKFGAKSISNVEENIRAAFMRGLEAL